MTQKVLHNLDGFMGVDLPLVLLQCHAISHLLAFMQAVPSEYPFSLTWLSPVPLLKFSLSITTSRNFGEPSQAVLNNVYLNSKNTQELSLAFYILYYAFIYYSICLSNQTVSALKVCTLSLSS